MPRYINNYTQRISGPTDARRQRNAERAVRIGTVKRALELVTQQMRQVIVDLTALQLGRQLRQKGAE